MKTRYYVCGLGYDENLEAIDYEVDFGDFDTYEEAYELFVKLQCRSVESFFVNASEVYEIDIRLEECEVTDSEIECIKIRNEWGIVNPKFKEERIMDISKLCYELYKVDWKHSHMITKDIEMDSIKDYYEGLVDADTEYTYEDYIEEFGYDGMLYVCYEEFCDAEYRDKEYICSLLDNEKLIAMYYRDIDEDNEF